MFTYSLDPFNIPSSQLPILGSPSIAIPLSFNHDLANSYFLFHFCNSPNLSSSLPSSIVSFHNLSVLLIASLIWWIHHFYEMASLLRPFSSLTLLSTTPLIFPQFLAYHKLATPLINQYPQSWGIYATISVRIKGNILIQRGISLIVQLLSPSLNTSFSVENVGTYGSVGSTQLWIFWRH
jgi:hypothetical protein